MQIRYFDRFNKLLGKVRIEMRSLASANFRKRFLKRLDVYSHANEEAQQRANDVLAEAIYITKHA